MFRPVMIDSRDAIGGQNNGTENFQSLNVKYLGPKAVCVFVSAIETGMIILLFARFVARRREKWAIQSLVYFVTFVALYVGFPLEALCYLHPQKSPSSDIFLILAPLISHFVDREQVSDGRDLRGMVANIGAGFRQLGK